MKKFIFLLLSFAFFSAAVSAQEQTQSEFFVGYQFLRQDVKIERPTLAFNENTDSHGFNANYTFYPKKESGRAGEFGFTAEVAGNFDRNDTSLVTAMGGVTVKARNNKFVQPFGKAVVGVARQSLNEAQFTTLPNFKDSNTSVAFAVGGGLDFNLKKESRYKLRVGADYLNTGFDGQRQNGIRLITGIVF
jgi:opacity protein-like surface antigen